MHAIVFLGVAIVVWLVLGFVLGRVLRQWSALSIIAIGVLLLIVPILVLTPHLCLFGMVPGVVGWFMGYRRRSRAH